MLQMAAMQPSAPAISESSLKARAPSSCARRRRTFVSQVAVVASDERLVFSSPERAGSLTCHVEADRTSTCVDVFASLQAIRVCAFGRGLKRSNRMLAFGS